MAKEEPNPAVTETYRMPFPTTASREGSWTNDLERKQQEFKEMMQARN